MTRRSLLAGLAQAGVVPAGVVPAGLAPAGLAPAGLAPAGLAPAGLAPAGLAPAGLALSGTALAGCTSAEPAYFTLAPVPGAAARGGPKLVELQRPGLAGYLDRPGIVRADSAYQLRVAGTERWGEPLGDLIARILSEDLNQRLSGTSVFTTAGSISAQPDARIELDVQRFDADASGEVVLLAQVAVSRGRNRAGAATRTVRQTMRPAGPATRDLVAAMSTVLGGLADTVAGMLRGLPAASPSPGGRGRRQPQ